jgi:hypothetical protein
MPLFTRSQALASVEAIAELPGEQKKVYTELLFQTKAPELIFSAYYDILHEFYMRNGIMPPPIACVTGSTKMSWDEFREHYMVIVKKLVLKDKDLGALKHLYRCYTDLLFLFKDPPSVREDLRRMIWKLYDNNPQTADSVVLYILRSESLPKYQRPPEYEGGARKRKRSVSKRRRRSITTRKRSKSTKRRKIMH